MVKLLVIADDFTGALDTGVQFSKNDMPAMVKIMSEAGSADALFQECPFEILVVDIESRHVSPYEAAQLIATLVHGADAYGIEYIYKKTDSTLRGNIGGELESMVKILDMDELIFIPAFPRAERTTVNGEQYVHMVPLNQTEFARDHLNPICSSLVKNIIGEQSDIATREIYLGEYAKLLDAPKKKGTISIVDAKEQTDFEELGRLLSGTEKLRYMAGCAGFAEMLPQLLPLDTRKEQITVSAGKSLLVSGSLTSVARMQIAYAEKHCGYGKLEFPLERILEADLSDLQKLAEEYSEAFSNYQKMAITVPPVNSLAMSRNDAGEAASARSNQIALRIGYVVSELIQRVKLSCLTVFGGDTLKGIMHSLGCDTIQPVAEIATGVVCSRLYSNPEECSFCMVTKAGGLGKEEVVEEIDDYLEKARQEHSSKH